jgi:hypothetical protein
MPFEYISKNDGKIKIFQIYIISSLIGTVYDVHPPCTADEIARHIKGTIDNGEEFELDISKVL